MTEVTPEKTVTMGITHYRQLVADCDRMAKVAFDATVRAMKAEAELEEAKKIIATHKENFGVDEA